MKFKKVLLVEDSEADQFYNKVILERFDPNIEILQAYDGQEALDMLDEMGEQPDLIFLDINMPVMDGHEFLEIYKTKEQQSVVALLTSSGQQSDKDLTSGIPCVKKYFIKPLAPEYLEELQGL